MFESCTKQRASFKCYFKGLLNRLKGVTHHRCSFCLSFWSEKRVTVWGVSTVDRRCELIINDSQLKAAAQEPTETKSNTRNKIKHVRTPGGLWSRLFCSLDVVLTFMMWPDQLVVYLHLFSCRLTLTTTIRWQRCVFYLVYSALLLKHHFMQL